MLRKQCTRALLFAGLAGCTSAFVPAPFAGRPDTVVPGDLRGPFDGRVVDDATGKPIDGAAVLASWAIDVGPTAGGTRAPSRARYRLVETDANGRYLVPRFEEHVAPAELARFTLVVHRRGYLPYRSDRRFDGFAPRHDFAQTANSVRLERTVPSTDYRRLVRFVGAGGPLLTKIGWELQQAGLEPAPPTEPPFSSSRDGGSP